MADPIVAPPPTISQPSTGPVTPPPAAPVDTSPGLEQVQRAFDKAYPMKGVSTAPPKEPAKPAEAPVAPVAPPQAPGEEPPKTDEKPAKPVEQKLPSFLEEALSSPRQPTTPAAPVEEDFPEELPTFKTSEEAKSRYKSWRTKYNELKAENKRLAERPSGIDPQTKGRMEFLENQNKEMSSVLTRMGVEQSAEFQNNIIRPLYASWNEASRLVKEAGADPQELAKAMSLTGRAQFEALDTLLGDMPDSAKAEITDALRTYRRFEDARKAALAEAPKTFEGIRKREMERQYAELNKQRDGMKDIFENALTVLRDKAKIEVLQRTNEPEAQWWNEQGDRLVDLARNLYLENTDMGKVAMACLMAPMADTYRTLWIKANEKVTQLNKIMKERFGSEPDLSERPGHSEIAMPQEQLAADLKRPFSEVFLREFHKSRARGGA